MQEYLASSYSGELTMWEGEVMEYYVNPVTAEDVLELEETGSCTVTSKLIEWGEDLKLRGILTMTVVREGTEYKIADYSVTYQDET